MAGATVDTATLEPVGGPADRPPEQATDPVDWIRKNLFNNWFNSLLTVVFSLLIAYVAFRAVRFVFVTARWEIIEVNLTNFMVGRFPREELLRPWIAIYIAALVGGTGVGLAAREGPRLGATGAAMRYFPGIALVVVFLAFARTFTPLLLTAGSFAVMLVGRWVGLRALPEKSRKWMPWLYAATVVAVFLAFAGFGGVGWDRWGGLLLTLFLAVGGIMLSFPIGVLLALGRRSTFPVVRSVCVGYIELIRGVPLITLLFMGSLALGFFFPPNFPRPGLVVRALIAMVLFTAAYVAEIVRGGLQGVPRGQTEAGLAVGLSPLKITYLIVLPQALRNVIPALVGQFISLFKDTSLVFIIGLLDLLGVAQTINSQPRFAGQGLQAETLLFASFVYWAFCYTMSRASQRLEKRLGVGER